MAGCVQRGPDRFERQLRKIPLREAEDSKVEEVAHLRSVAFRPRKIIIAGEGASLLFQRIPEEAMLWSSSRLQQSAL